MNNKLTSLPRLPASLKTLYCENNNLATLPDIPDTVVEINCKGNPIYDYIPYPATVEQTIYTVKTLNRVAFLIHALKFKKKFRDWLWLRVRLPKIERVNHPDRLREALETSDDLEESIDKFGIVY
jgi:Leucine-rich repeat (LRR) protein